MDYIDSRGRGILEVAVRFGHCVVSVGVTTTFRRSSYGRTIPDITLASKNIVRDVANLRVMKEHTGSDHQHVSYSVMRNRLICRNPAPSDLRWNVPKMDEQTLALTISQGKDATTECPGRREENPKAIEDEHTGGTTLSRP